MTEKNKVQVYRSQRCLEVRKCDVPVCEDVCTVNSRPWSLVASIVFFLDAVATLVGYRMTATWRLLASSWPGKS